MNPLPQIIKNIKIKNIKNELSPGFIKKLPYEAPYFLFSKAKILSNYKRFKKLFPGSTIHYAMKANSEPEILKTLRDAGAGFEVASKYELAWLKKVNVDPSKIIYGTSVKPASHIKAFANYGVDKFAFDSFSELEKIASIAPGSKVYVRTIANDTGSVFKFSEKFGTDQASIIPLLLRARELGLQPYGISFNVGSQASDPYAWANTIISLKSTIQELKELGITLEVLNLGGGYPCQYASTQTLPTLEEIAKKTLDAYKKLPYKLNLMLEPGRGIIADTAVLVTNVIARIERRGSTWLFLDVGVYNGLFETMAYQGSTKYPVTSIRPASDSGESIYALAGPTGDSPDVINRETLLPSDIEVGDKLIFQHVGAYSLSVLSEFNGFPKPDVYLI